MKSKEEVKQAIVRIGTKAKEICVASGTWNGCPPLDVNGIDMLTSIFTSEIPVPKKDITLPSFYILGTISTENLYVHAAYKCTIKNGIESIEQKWIREGVTTLSKMIEAECHQVSA